MLGKCHITELYPTPYSYKVSIAVKVIDSESRRAGGIKEQGLFVLRIVSKKKNKVSVWKVKKILDMEGGDELAQNNATELYTQNS